ncbi:MAG: hypothetical protein JSU58_00050, partial [Dehalococcoidales bacterium]
LKLSPEGQATPYLASAALAGNIGAGIGPLVGGILAGFFANRELTFVTRWFDQGSSIELTTISIGSFDFLFVITFFLGLITLSMLAVVREEGEVSREVVLETLTLPIREFSQQVTTVPTMNFIKDIPLGNLKRLPVPGLDVVLGVTAYQIADTAKSIAAANMHVRRMTKAVEQSVRKSFTHIWKVGQTTGDNVEITASIVRGALHGILENQEKPEDNISEIILGVFQAAEKEQVNLDDILAGIGQGIIHGAVETDMDLNLVVKETLTAVSKIATSNNILEKTAVDKVTEGMVDVAQGLGEATYIKILESVQRSQDD